MHVEIVIPGYELLAQHHPSSVPFASQVDVSRSRIFEDVGV
jgi:hypothetical protein